MSLVDQVHADLDSAPVSSKLHALPEDPAAYYPASANRIIERGYGT